MSHKKGYIEAVKAIGAAIAVFGTIALACYFLSGCAGSYVAGRYTHHSSIPKYYDPHESNMAGIVVGIPACGNLYCPTLELAAQWDLRKGEHNHPYGTDPVGTINITQPIWIKGN